MKIEIILFLLFSSIKVISSDTPLHNYCIQHKGVVVNTTAEYDTYSGFVDGYSKQFCRIEQKGNLGYIGLDTLGSKKPSLAATYAKTIVLDPTKLIKGPFETNSLNLCYALGGSCIVYFLADGGFTDEYGQIDICMFGDGSTVAGWTLAYMGYKERKDIKNAIIAAPLSIPIPNIPYV